MFSSRTSGTILSLFTNLESSDHLDSLGFKSGTHKKDKSIWKVERHAALASFIALIAGRIEDLLHFLYIVRQVPLLCHKGQEASLIYPINRQAILHVDSGRGLEGFEGKEHIRMQNELDGENIFRRQSPDLISHLNGPSKHSGSSSGTASGLFGSNAIKLAEQGHKYGITTSKLAGKNIEERASRSNQAPKYSFQCIFKAVKVSLKGAILSLCTNLDSNDHFDCLGFKSGTHRKDKSIWKIEMHTALASLSALIAAIVSCSSSSKIDVLASLLIFLLKETSSLVVPQTSRSLTDLSNKSSTHSASRLWDRV
ncbi:hypothetical protein H5410_008447 [Solanum commersonii]|uniref:Uncharacterized protein n=1 Tax=Solanum commersonii TaxID=4109 RepID=A0A9J6AEZ8_SOLCO|nr:hypothetical protein H5410_008447 [Solanum commersonii]